MSIKKKIGMGLATVALGAMLIGGGTLAIFTDSATNTSNTFTAGTLDISLDKADGTKYFDISNIAPGDSGSTTITVSNDGSLELRYDIATSLTGDLATSVDEDGDTVLDGNQLVVTITDSSNAVVLPGDNNRVLAANGQAGDSETFTVSWSLPYNAGNFYQGKNASYAFTVNAEQTRNN
jgi:predicted ribosomally synthesized peptide with SipW-like signal peptide